MNPTCTPGLGALRRRAVALAVVAAVPGCGVTRAAAERVETAAPAPTCGHSSATRIATELKAQAQKGIPDCPEAQAPDPGVTTSGPSTLTDTGLTRCRVRTDNDVAECPHGLTIHIETKPCRFHRCEQGTAAAPCEGTTIVGVVCRVHSL